MSTATTDTIDPMTEPAGTESPRVRWAAILWGALFATAALAGLRLISSADGRADLSDWVLTLTPAAITALAVLTAGVLLLVAGAAGLIRRAQRRRALRRTSPSPSSSPSPEAEPLAAAVVDTAEETASGR